jgi:hypothetical protein
MCDRTVEGTDIETLRTVPGEDGEYRTVSAQDFGWRNVTGINGGGAPFLGTEPSRQNFTVSGTYTPTAGCIYFQVYLIGAGGGGAGGFQSQARGSGGGGGGGACAVGFFHPATYTFVLGTGGEKGILLNDGSPGTDSTFGNLTAGGGGGGLCPLLTSTTYAVAAPGVALNSVLPIGNIQAICGGNLGANSGANMFQGKCGRGGETNTLITALSGEQGGGGCHDGSGGAGRNGHLIIIEYF